MSRRLWATGGTIFHSLFLSAAETNSSALPSKIFDEVDKIEKGVNGDLATALDLE